jgi:hypothetical protein
MSDRMSVLNPVLSHAFKEYHRIDKTIRIFKFVTTRLCLQVTQEVDRRLFEEKLFREKRLATEREDERRRRHAELERMRRSLPRSGRCDN